jgi:hypothetical protein
LNDKISPLVSLNPSQDEFTKNFKSTNYEKLNASLRPSYYNFFISLSRVHDGVETMVKMRANLLTMLEQKSRLSCFCVNFEISIF